MHLIAASPHTTLSVSFLKSALVGGSGAIGGNGAVRSLNLTLIVVTDLCSNLHILIFLENLQVLFWGISPSGRFWGIALP